MREEDIQNERRALDKLCFEKHPNIVTVFRHSQLSGSSFYAIDMEYCQSTLQDWIRDPIPVNQIWELDDLHLYRDDDAKRWNRVGKIMRDILLGLGFIHSRKEVHRDLKPSNGHYTHYIMLIHSSLQIWQTKSMENRRLWLYNSRLVKENYCHLKC